MMKNKQFSALSNHIKLQKPVNRVSIAEYNREIDEAVTRVEAGEFYTHEEVEKMAEEW